MYLLLTHLFPSQIVTVYPFMLRAKIPWHHPWSLYFLYSTWTLLQNLTGLEIFWHHFLPRLPQTLLTGNLAFTLASQVHAKHLGQRAFSDSSQPSLLSKASSGFPSPSESKPYWTWPCYCSDLHSLLLTGSSRTGLLPVLWTHQAHSCRRVFMPHVPCSWNAIPPYLHGSFPHFLQVFEQMVPSQWGLPWPLHLLASPISLTLFKFPPLPLSPSNRLYNLLMCIVYPFHPLLCSPTPNWKPHKGRDFLLPFFLSVWFILHA